MIHFLVVEDYELPKSTSHASTVQLTLECARIFSWFIFFFFYFNYLPDDVLCKISMVSMIYLILSKLMILLSTWRCGVVVTTTAQLHSTKPELRFCAGSNPARGVSEICDGEDLWQWSRLEIKLNAFCRSTIPHKQFIIIITNHLTCPMSCKLILKIWKRNTKSIRKCNSAYNYIYWYLGNYSIFTS